MDRMGIVILAAGNSSRLGRPKQLLPYQGKTLLSHVAEEALGADLQPVVVVTGAYHAAVSDSLKGLPLHIVFNPYWETGMASGLVAGLDKALSLEPNLSSLIVAVCDQPHISAEIFRALAAAWTVEGKGLTGCRYSETIGTPVLFDRRYFVALSALTGDEGARKLLKKYADDISTIPFAEGGIDIDTEDDFRGLQPRG